MRNQRRPAGAAIQLGGLPAHPKRQASHQLWRPVPPCANGWSYLHRWQPPRAQSCGRRGSFHQRGCGAKHPENGNGGPQRPSDQQQSAQIWRGSGGAQCWRLALQPGEGQHWGCGGCQQGPRHPGSAQRCPALHCEGPEPRVAKQLQKGAAQDPGAGVNSPVIKLQPGRLLVTPSGPTRQSWKRVPNGRKNGIATHSVESIGEVKLEVWCLRCQARTVWIAFSAPPETATRPEEGLGIIPHQAHQALARQRRISPTAIGRTPPWGLGRTTCPAPANTGAKKSGALPWASKFTTAVSWERKASLLPATFASFRCWTRSPLGPGAVSGGKARRHRATASGAISGATGRSFMAPTLGGGCCGWRARKASAVAAVGGHSPLDRRAAQALRSNPSRAKPVAKAFRCSGSSSPRPRCNAVRESQRDSRSPSCQRCKRSKVYACGFSMLPAASGGGAKDTLREHAKFTPSFVIIAMGDSSTGPSQDLSPSMASGAIGTCRRVAVLAAWMAERDM